MDTSKLEFDAVPLSLAFFVDQQATSAKADTSKAECLRIFFIIEYLLLLFIIFYHRDSKIQNRNRTL